MKSYVAFHNIYLVPVLSCLVNLFYVCVFSTQEKAPLFYYWRVGQFFLSLMYLYKMSKWMEKHVNDNFGYFQAMYIL